MADVEHDREAGRRQLVEQGLGDLAGPVDAHARHPHGFSPADEVDPRRIPGGFVAELLLVAVINHVVASVVEHGVHDGKAELRGDEQLAPGHLHPAVAADTDHLAIAVSDGVADGGADPRRHAAEPEVDREALRSSGGEVVETEEHVLADVGDERRVRADRRLQIVDHAVGRERGRVVGAEALEVERRALDCFGHDRRGVRVEELEIAGDLAEAPHERGEIAGDTQARGEVAVEDRGIEIDVDQRAVRTDGGSRADRHVVEIGPDREAHVHLAGGVAPRPPRARHSEVAERVGVVFGDEPLRLRRGHERDAQGLDHPLDRARVGPASSAHHDEGTASRRQHLGHVDDDVIVDVTRGRRANALDLVTRVDPGGPGLDRHDEQGRARVLGVRRCAQRGDGLRRRRARDRDADRRPRDVLEHLFDADPLAAQRLQQAAARRSPRDVAADDDHRHALEVRRDDAGDHVRGAGSRRHHDRRDLPGRAPVPHRREDRVGLVPGFNQRRARGPQDGVEQRHHGPAGEPEVRVDPRCFERADDPRGGGVHFGLRQHRRIGEDHRP